MVLKTKVATYTLISMARKFQDFFHNEPKDVTFDYMDMNEDIVTETVPNIKKLHNEILDKVLLNKVSKEDGDVLDINTINTLNSFNSSYSVKLPDTPNDGDLLFIFDIGNYAGTNVITVERNGELIADDEDDLIIDIDSAFNIMYYLKRTGSWYLSVLGG